MCKAKSFICVKGETEPRWSQKHDSHAELIAEIGLKDEALHLRKFVKIEYFPVNDNWFSPSDKWTFRVDEEKTVPAWFEDDRQLWEDRCWAVIKHKVFPLIKCGVFPGDLYVYSNAKIKTPKLIRVNKKPYNPGWEKKDCANFEKETQ